MLITKGNLPTIHKAFQIIDSNSDGADRADAAGAVYTVPEDYSTISLIRMDAALESLTDKELRTFCGLEGSLEDVAEIASRHGSFGLANNLLDAYSLGTI